MALSVDPTTLTDDVVVSITDEARDIVRDAMASESDPASLALWIDIRGVNAGAFVYDLYFQGIADATEGDARYLYEDVAVVIPEKSRENLQGARLEFSTEGEGGLVLVNPNQPKPDLSGQGVPSEVLAQGLNNTVAQHIIAVLESEVNPSIASHGGRCDLVAFDATANNAYVRLSGGCQGCAMSRMTLTQGIETMLRDQIPTLDQIIDVTDHSGGENPFY